MACLASEAEPIPPKQVTYGHGDPEQFGISRGIVCPAVMSQGEFREKSSEGK